MVSGYILPLVLFLTSLVPSLADVLVQTNHGPVQGNVTVYNGQSLTRFYGIPYARPPIGQLRFKPPQEPETWRDTLMAWQYSDICVQARPLDGIDQRPMSEDCLYLNVYVPGTEHNRNLPVMVWIHGGGLELGSGGDIPPDGLVLHEDVIAVTINYRLDVFGFFSTGSDAAEGNVGMLDQVLALKWVKANIAAFGGNPDQITIFGESAGSWSVTAHLISPLSAGLFTRVIAQSGSLHNFHVETGTERLAASQQFIAELGCTSDDEDEIVNCLQTKTTDEIMTQNVSKYTADPTPVTAGGSFLPLQPEDMWSKYTPSADLIIGINSEEATFALDFAKALLPTGGYDDIVQNGISYDHPFFALLSSTTVVAFPDEFPTDSGLAMVFAQYMGGLKEDDKFGILRGILDALADRYFLSPSLLTALATRAAGRDVYTYYFAEVTKTEALGAVIPDFFPYVAALDSGAAHATELLYVLGQIATEDVPLSAYDLATEVDRNLSRSMIRAWGSFAKTGKPMYLTSDGVEVEWPEYLSDDKKYVEFSSPMSADSVKSDLSSRAENFWNVMMPAVIGQYTQTGSGHTGSGTGSDGTKTCSDSDDVDDDVSLIDRSTAETILFILVAVVVTLSLVSVLLLCNYCSSKKELNELKALHSKC